MWRAIQMTGLVMILGFTVSMANEPGHGYGKDERHHGMMCGPRHGGFGHGSMGGMMRAQMLSSSDGGVIVLRGGTLYKYDKDLNLKKQVELPHPEGWGKFKDGRDSGMMMERRHWHHEADSNSSQSSSPGAK
jgi:hypothetical protein